jgi:hypothetical protein
MILRVLVALSMTAFCAWEGFAAASVPSASGRNYLPVIYIAVPILLWSGLNPRGLITWPLATVLLLLRGHLFVGWVPLALVIFNLVGNEVARKRGG